MRIDGEPEGKRIGDVNRVKMDSMTLRMASGLFPSGKIIETSNHSTIFHSRYRVTSMVAVKPAVCQSQGKVETQEEKTGKLSRRALFLLATAAGFLVNEDASASSSGAVAGRLPGLSDLDENGLRTYKRPEGKSGGHGIGWSELIPYSFRVPDSWEEIPVSIADLGGTEIDLRFTSQQGNLSVVVAPVLRFSDGLGNNVQIEDIGPPMKIINAFGPELTGQTVEGSVLDSSVKSVNGRTYYQFELQPHMLVSATAAGNRMYILSVTASGRQWKKYSEKLRAIADSFIVG